MLLQQDNPLDAPVQGISRQGRSSSGVKVFDTAEEETVASVAWIAEQGHAEENINENDDA